MSTKNKQNIGDCGAVEKVHNFYQARQFLPVFSQHNVTSED
jgi:hypothetical protein